MLCNPHRESCDQRCTCTPGLDRPDSPTIASQRILNKPLSSHSHCGARNFSRPVKMPQCSIGPPDCPAACNWRHSERAHAGLALSRRSGQRCRLVPLPTAQGRIMLRCSTTFIRPMRRKSAPAPPSAPPACAGRTRPGTHRCSRTPPASPHGRSRTAWRGLRRTVRVLPD